MADPQHTPSIFSNIGKITLGHDNPLNLGPRRFAHLEPVRGENRVLLISGFAGAGKTTLIETIANGLGEHHKKIAVIVNEQKGASTQVDLDRLAEDMLKIGIDGCACCASNTEVLDALKRFGKVGTKLSIIEQSGLSRTGELSTTIERAGFHPYVISVVSVEQLDSAFRRYVIPHVRAADAVFLTHVPDIGGEALARARALIGEATSDLAQKPKVVVMASPTSAFPPDVWESLSKSPVQNAQGVFGKLEALSGTRPGRSPIPGIEQQRLIDVSAFCEIEVILYPGLTPLEIGQALAHLTTDDGKNVEILRAKGVVSGKDLDYSVGDSGAKLQVVTRGTPSQLYNGQAYLVIRALNPRLRYDCWREISAKLGTPECGLDSARAVMGLYPSLQDFQRQAQDGNLHVVFGADSLLWELAESLAHIANVPDKSRQQQLAVSVAHLTHKFLAVRLDLMNVLVQPATLSQRSQPEWMFNFGFVASRVLVHPQLERMIASQDALRGPAERLWRMQPIKQMFVALSKLHRLQINGRSELTGADLYWLKKLAQKGLEGKELTPQLLAAIFGRVKEVAQRTQNTSWLGSLPKLADAFGVAR